MTVPLNLRLEKNKLSTASPWLILLDITLTSGEVIRLVRNTEDIVFNGNTYTAFNFELTPVTQGSRGELTVAELSVSNVTQLLEPYLQTLKGGLGSTVKITTVNAALLAENYSDLELNFDVTTCEANNQWVVFGLGSPNLLRQRFPSHKVFASQCRYDRYNFPTNNYPECGYIGVAVQAITLTPGQPVQVRTVDALHPFATGDVLGFMAVEGTTELNGNSYTITDTGDDTVTLDGTDGANFTAHVAATGRIGYATCRKTLTDCRDRDNSARFGGFPGMRSGGIRLV